MSGSKHETLAYDRKIEVEVVDPKTRRVYVSDENGVIKVPAALAKQLISQGRFKPNNEGAAS